MCLIIYFSAYFNLEVYFFLAKIMVPNFIISSIIITIIILNWETKQESQKYEEVFQKSMSFCFEN